MRRDIYNLVTTLTYHDEPSEISDACQRAEGYLDAVCQKADMKKITQDKKIGTYSCVVIN